MEFALFVPIALAVKGKVLKILDSLWYGGSKESKNHTTCWFSADSNIEEHLVGNFGPNLCRDQRQERHERNNGYTTLHDNITKGSE